MPLFIKSVLITALLSIPILGGAVIGANYPSPILTHLVDIINGPNTSTHIVANAPNWAFATPLPTVQGLTAATSTGGTLASSTTYTFGVAALGRQGTTTIQNTTSVTTAFGAATTNINLTWSAVAGAQGYAVFFATGTPSVLDQYFYASTTNAYNFSTSSGSLAGSYTNSDTTAFNDVINPVGPSYILGNNGTATTTVASSSALEVNGNLRTTSNGTTTNCYAGTAGAVFFNTANKHEWGCDGTNWNKIF